MGSTVIEMDLGDEARSSRAPELLSNLRGGHKATENETICVTTEDGSWTLMDVPRALTPTI